MERRPAPKHALPFARQIPVLLLVMALGCSPDESTDSSSDSAKSPTKSAVDTGPPEQTVHEFMMAFKNGDDTKASELVSEKTQNEMKRTDFGVSPPGSKDMKFQVGKVQYVPDSTDLARVDCHIEDKDEDGEDVKMDVVWFLRKEQPGWRIAGIAMKVFPDLPAVLYNFEDMDDVQRKAAMVDQEMARRATQTLTEGQQPAQQTGNEAVTAPQTNVAELPNSQPGVRK